MASLSLFAAALVLLMLLSFMKVLLPMVVAIGVTSLILCFALFRRFSTGPYIVTTVVAIPIVLGVMLHISGWNEFKSYCDNSSAPSFSGTKLEKPNSLLFANSYRMKLGPAYESQWLGKDFDAYQSGLIQEDGSIQITNDCKVSSNSLINSYDLSSRKVDCLRFGNIKSRYAFVVTPPEKSSISHGEFLGLSHISIIDRENNNRLIAEANEAVFQGQYVAPLILTFVMGNVSDSSIACGYISRKPYAWRPINPWDAAKQYIIADRKFLSSVFYGYSTQQGL